MKKDLFFGGILLSFISLNFACQKSDASADISSVVQENVHLKKLYSYKIDNWEAYPYYTDSPDEDSILFSLSPDLSNVVLTQFTEVYVKRLDGSIVPAPKFVAVGPDDSGFLYQPGFGAYENKKVLLWWIQKVDGTRPDADSCILAY